MFMYIKNYIIHLKYIQFLFVNYTSIELEKKVNVLIIT